MYLNELKKLPLSKESRVTIRQRNLLEKLNVISVYDLITYYPTRYEDRSKVEPIEKSLLEKRLITTVVRVIGHESIYFQGKRHPKILVQDDKIRAYLIGFNRQFLFESMKIGQSYWISAQFEYKFNEVQTSSFDFEKYSPDVKPQNFGSVLPIYRLTDKLTIKELRKIIFKGLEHYLSQLKDNLPTYLLKHHNLASLDFALENIHFPKKMTDYKKARVRLAFDEFLAIQLLVQKRRLIYSHQEKEGLPDRNEKMSAFLKQLPFAVTGAQNRCIDEIVTDLKSPKPMHRLLQGDVGSGKTTVALAAMIFTTENDYQSALLVPTEVLAIQHYTKIREAVNALGFDCELLTGSTSQAERQRILSGIADGSVQIVIGTHALLYDTVKFHNLRLVIIDEQHKFGVEQRTALSRKSENPDVLVMTATPIPRTLTLTVFGDLNVSTIDEMPANRLPIRTEWFRRKEYKKALDFVYREVKKGYQAFFIYPLIEESEKINSRSAVTMHQKLDKYYHDLKIGLIHGRLNPSEKNETMDAFARKELDIVISTTVIEVGIDIPNATVMVIENAERFGLSQLHQLRGRVGRGDAQSYCFLITNDEIAPESESRMQCMVDFSDGFSIAEEDLRLRGPGEIMGSRQSGMPDLKVGHFLHDEKLLRTAKDDAVAILNHDPGLNLPEDAAFREGILPFLPEEFASSG